MDDAGLELEGTAFISRFLAAGEKERAELKAAGVQLADRLSRRAIDLSYAKATEFSPKISLYFLLAAKVALLTHWPDSEAVAPFERPIRNYANYASTRLLGEEYESFRAAYTGDGGSMSPEPSPRFARMRLELEQAKWDFSRLLAAIPDDDLDRRLAGGAWTPRQELVHVVQALELLPRGIERAVGGGGRSLLSLVPASVRGWVNGYVIVPMRARGATRASIAEAYENAWTRLVDRLRALPEEAWDRGAPYPRQYRTVEQMARRVAEHLEHHAAHLCNVLGIERHGIPAP